MIFSISFLISVIVFNSKATTLDGTFAPAWIGYGNAYAAQEEGDQAMSAYRTGARLFPGLLILLLLIYFMFSF